ncbi:large conductance mechanosensitive channel protein MscL [Corynebacterium gallinarum]|uniref:Large-conductance mechanosensitive channel n=1 Tax=Corynebacterium gallinarum TaxID=2762214 RepID=A0A8I0LFZ6_9CORY|nr:large conductance mechanosensitive channel protein MscL [Corynebacterium gallinarum]MBD8030738.1 large conductance mechanosensitive channel protein MscL [Corynebacterium gallinarum]
MFKGFRDFILRGNVVELAVAVVIGTAFTGIVTAFSNHIINPLIASVGGADVSGLGFHIFSDNPATFVDFGAVITAAINFLIIAAIVYFVLITPMNKLNEALARRKGVEEEEGTPASLEAELLTEIRDLLREQKKQQVGPQETGRDGGVEL